MADSIHSFTAKLASGDAGTVEVFYRRHFDFLYAQARRASGRDESFCLDVVQESVLRVLRSVRAADSERQFNAWLKLVVQTTAYDLLRSESRRQRREAAFAATVGAAGGNGEHLSDDDRLVWLRRQIAALDPRIVQLVELRFTKSWPLARIAGALGLTIGTVDGRLRRALAELRTRASEVFDE